MLLKLHYILFTSKDKAKRGKALLSIPTLFRGTWICFVDISVKFKLKRYEKDSCCLKTSFLNALFSRIEFLSRVLK